VLIRRQQFDSVHEKCIMLKTKVFMCHMSEKCQKNGTKRFVKNVLCYKCLVKRVYRGVEKFQMTGCCVLDKEL